MNAELGMAPLQRTWRISFNAAALLAAIVFTGHLTLLLAHPATPGLLLARRAIFPVESLLAALGLCHAARSSAALSRRLYGAWSVLALAQVFYAFGDVLWAGSAVAAQAGPFLLASNALYALYYPAFLAGLLLFPFPERMARDEWVRLALDVGIVLIGCILVACTFLGGPLLAAGQAPAGMAQVVALAYPAADFLLLLAVLGLLLRRTVPQRHAPLLLLGCSSTVLILTHAIFVYQYLLNVNISRGLLDLGWGAASLLAGLAGALQAVLPPDRSGRAEASPLRLAGWQLYLPYLSLGLAYILLIWRQDHAAAISFPSLAAGVGAIVALILARQMVVVNENTRLYAQWHQGHNELEQRVAERTADLAQINEDLHAEMRSNAQLYLSLQQTNQQLVAAMQAKDEMLQNVSHELRTPLMLIFGYVELLHSDELGPLEPEQAEAVEIILRQSERLRFMVNRLLTMQTFEAGKLKPAPLDVRPWIEQSVEAWQVRAAQAGVTLTAEVAPGLPAITVDRDFLGQVLENLLDNAVKFTEQHGHIVVRSWAADGNLMLAVADDGVGIPPGKLAQVFERFYQVNGSSSRRFGGMGIGLALCRKIIDAHHGRIWAESPGENQGSTFYLALPLAPQS